MSRIERLIWEETQMNRIELLKPESHATTGAKVISIMFVVGMIALLATPPSLPSVDEAITQAAVAESFIDVPVIERNPANDVGPAAAALSRDAADAAARAAKQDDPPIATF